MATRQIIIIGSIPVTEELILEPPETMAEVGDEIVWVLKDPEVYSFKIKKKTDSPDIFESSFLNSDHGKGERGLIKMSAGGAKYIYSIYWRNKKGGKELHFDPIISVKPTTL